MKKQKIKFRGREINICIRDDADESVVAEIFDWREYKMAEDAISKTKDLILDVGAHIGVFSIYAKTINPLARIYAFEPEENNFEFLKKNLTLNKISDVKIFHMALAGFSGKRELLLGADNINHRLLSKGPRGEKTVFVKAMSLSDFLEEKKDDRIGLLKMDIEGGEYEILENLSAEDFEKIENIVLEYHEFDGRNRLEIENILRENGFGVQVFPSRFEKGLGFMFARNKRKQS